MAAAAKVGETERAVPSGNLNVPGGILVIHLIVSAYGRGKSQITTHQLESIAAAEGGVAPHLEQAA
jgi:hypothetical protein